MLGTLEGDSGKTSPIFKGRETTALDALPKLDLFQDNLVCSHMNQQLQPLWQLGIAKLLPYSELDLLDHV